jgi:hypothetical protein
MNSPEDVIAGLSPVLSPWRRVGGVVALLAGGAGAGLTGTLWLTEPGALPDRTHLAFAVLVAVCLCWTGYGGWVLLRRAPMFALHRVVAGWLALAASTVTTLVTTVVAVQRDTLPAAVLGVGLVFVGVSGAVTVRAHRHRAALLRRKADLGRASG